MTPIRFLPASTATSGARSCAMIAATSTIVSSAFTVGMSGRSLGEYRGDRLPAQLVGDAVGHRLAEHSRQCWVVADVSGYEQADHLRRRQDRRRTAVLVGYHKPPREPVLGHQSHRVQGAGVGCDDGGEFFGDLLGAHR